MKFFVIALILLVAVGTNGDDFLSNWMGEMLPLVGNHTLLDIALPGTHDSMSYDLTTIVSDGGDDDSEWLSWILHYASEIGVVPGSWIRDQAKTQGLDVIEQLNNGVRFIDFRVMFSSGDWYCLHFMQSQFPALFYLKKIRSWLDLHPSEIIVMWFSKHGGACATGNDQFPGVSIETKRKFWKDVEDVFSGLLLDTRNSSTNETSLNNLINSGYRVVLYLSDYVEFSDSTYFAMDACKFLDNSLCCNDMTDINTFQNSGETKRTDKSLNKFYLHSLTSSEAFEQLEYAFLVHFIPFERESNTKKCAELFGVPNMTNWCPEYLQEISQLHNYYKQLSFSAALKNSWDFPNAIYLDAVDVNGTIRTGTKNFFPNQIFFDEKDAEDDDHGETKYSYAHILLFYNLRIICGSNPTGNCQILKNYLEDKISAYPLQRWEDQQHGRLINWPV